ncbi:type VII secretion-associated serine protease mycosin [compost metagenome]
MNPLVGIIDSGLSDDILPCVKASRCFTEEAYGGEAQIDRIAHGSTLAKLVLEQCADTRLLIAQIFSETRQAPVMRVVEAMDWLVESGAQIINMSFGLSSPSPALLEACKRATEKGVILVASAPARGGAVYPASLPNCISVSGDARCAIDQHSWLCSAQIDFGANPLVVPGEPDRGGGSSFACARFAGKIARYMGTGFNTPQSVEMVLRLGASYLGRERRLA